MDSSSERIVAIDARKVLDFGIGTYIRGLVTALAELETRVHKHGKLRFRYVLLTPPNVEIRSLVGQLPENFSTVEEAAPVYSVRELFSVSKTLREIGADLYHATHYVLPLRPPCATVVTIHDLIHLLFPEFLPNRKALLYSRFMLRRAVRISRRVLTVSQNTAADLKSHLGAENVEVVYNGVDQAFHDPIAADHAETVIARHDLSPGYILFVGNPKPHKNLPRVLAAYSKAKRAGNDVPPLVCVGSSSEAEFIQSKASELEIRDSVRVLGFVDQDELPSLYGAAKVLLFPGLYEGFGLPVLEAMAVGTPVITSKTSSLGEIAADAAITVDPEDVDEISARLVQLLNSTEQRRELSDLGRQRSQAFSWRATAEATARVYREVLMESLS